MSLEQAANLKPKHETTNRHTAKKPTIRNLIGYDKKKKEWYRWHRHLNFLFVYFNAQPYTDTESALEPTASPTDSDWRIAVPRIQAVPAA